MRTISIVIPAHNEERRIRRTLEKYGEFFREKKKKKEIKDFEIVIIINNTHDGTEEIVKKFSGKYKEIRYLKFEQGGKGFAIIEGFKDALKKGNEIVGFVDADMSTPPFAFYELIKNIRGYDGAIADRWNKKSIFQYSMFKKIRSRVYNFWVRALFLFPYRDTQCGAKIFKREILEKNMKKVVSSDLNFDVALLFCLRRETNARIISVPTVWREEGGSTVFSIKSPIRMFLSAFRLRIFHSPFKFLLRAHSRLPERIRVNSLIEKIKH
jgi:glycosyltransferase involved in cell wall biosynthesis